MPLGRVPPTGAKRGEAQPPGRGGWRAPRGGGRSQYPCTKLLAATLEAVVVLQPVPTEQEPQRLCLDKAYDNPTGWEAIMAHHSVPHMRRIGEKQWDESLEKRSPARRWGVERTLAKVFVHAAPF